MPEERHAVKDYFPIILRARAEFDHEGRSVFTKGEAARQSRRSELSGGFAPASGSGGIVDHAGCVPRERAAVEVKIPSRYFDPESTLQRK